MIELLLAGEYYANLVLPNKIKKASDCKTSKVSGNSFLREKPKILENPFIALR